ncbi:pentapeptide repeat-containing protein [Candidatus Nitrosopelagicus sp.]|nr:pentapeptide repeat-containing protein [Candidatus Nitrosopelagicus sp.]
MSKLIIIIFTFSIILFLSIGIDIPNVNAQSVPDWVKNTAGWWATDAISENEFVNAIEYLVKAGIIQVENYPNYENIPDWLKNNPSWVEARNSTNTSFENFDISYLKQELNVCEDCTISINQHGFRGTEFFKEKSNDVYRIFAVGGSTTHGATLVNDNETWPAFLQQIVDEKIIDNKIQIINVGIMAATTESELVMISEKIVKFNPNMIIMYDGWNDSYNLPLEHSIDNWKSICKLGNDQNFETIIIIQPILGSGNRILTEQEITLFNSSKDKNIQNLEMLEKYSSSLNELDKHCTKTANFKNIFDYIFSPIFVDSGHTSTLGNKIIAENVFNLLENILMDNEQSNSLQKINYLKYSSITKNGIFAPNADFSNNNFSNMILKNSIFDMSDLSSANLLNVDLSNSRLYSVNLVNSNLIGANLSNSNLSYANLSGLDLSDTDLSETILIGANLSNTKLGNMNFEGRDFEQTKLDYQDFSYRNLLKSNFKNSSFNESNLQNTNLSKSIFIDVDLTKITNKSLKDTDITETVFSYSNLSNIKFPTEFKFPTFYRANLNDSDFSNSSSIGTIFFGTQLQNANFENSNFSIIQETKTFENALELTQEEIRNKISIHPIVMLTKLTPDGNNLHVEYLIYNYFMNANLENANMKNTNFIFTDFTNANLRNVDLSNSNLNSVFFKDANLEGANLEGANLEGANLEGANLEGANLKNAVLNCISHEICN